MKEINNKGFGKIEFMTILGLLAVLIALGSKIATNIGINYSGFKSTVNNFLNAVALYKDMYPKDSNIYYLNEVIEKGYITDLKNPIDNKLSCNRYESYVKVPTPSNKIIYLDCGNYLVEGTQKDGFKVYEVGNWEEIKEQGDTTTLYNYKKDGVEVLDEYVPERTFVELFFDKNHVLIESPSDLLKNNEVELLTKKVYRTKKLVKELQ